MKRRSVILLFLAAGLLPLASTGCKKNPADNTRPPEPWTDKPVENHHFDGGEKDPYGNNNNKDGEGGGEKAAPKGE